MWTFFPNGALLSLPSLIERDMVANVRSRKQQRDLLGNFLCALAFSSFSACLRSDATLDINKFSDADILPGSQETASRFFKITQKKRSFLGFPNSLSTIPFFDRVLKRATFDSKPKPTSYEEVELPGSFNGAAAS